MQAHERLQDFPKQQLVDRALHSIIILLTKTEINFIPGSWRYRSIPAQVHRLWSYYCEHVSYFSHNCVNTNYEAMYYEEHCFYVFVVMKSAVILTWTAASFKQQ